MQVVNFCHDVLEKWSSDSFTNTRIDSSVAPLVAHNFQIFFPVAHQKQSQWLICPAWNLMIFSSVLENWSSDSLTKNLMVKLQLVNHNLCEASCLQVSSFFLFGLSSSTVCSVWNKNTKAQDATTKFAHPLTGKNSILCNSRQRKTVKTVSHKENETENFACEFISYLLVERLWIFCTIKSKKNLILEKKRRQQFILYLST